MKYSIKKLYIHIFIYIVLTNLYSMSESLWGFSLEDGNLGNTVSEVSQEDVKAVQNDQKKAKKVFSDIKNQQKKDKITATLLSCILENINDELFVNFYLFYKKSWVSINSLFFIFAPFLWDRLDMEIFLVLNYDKPDKFNNISSYIDYLDWFIKNFDFSKQVKYEFVNLIVSIIYNYDLWKAYTSLSDLDEPDVYKKKLIDSIYSELFI